LEARWITPIVALAIVVAALSPGASAARAERVAVLVVPSSAPIFRSPTAAHGLLVAGEGSRVSRRGALASLLRGKMGNSLVGGGVPGGRPLISLAKAPGRITFYVALPPPGSHHNVVRYPLAVAGPGYSGILVSSATRLDGLVSIADVAPSARALARGERPRIRPRPEAEPLTRLAGLDRRLGRSHDTRVAAMVVLAALMSLFGLLALATRVSALGRAAFLAAPACVVAAVALSALGISTRWVVILALALLGATSALAGGLFLRPLLPLALALAACFGFLFTVMWAEPQWNTLAVIGPHPDGGGRFYGVTNQVETLLLAPALVLGALVGIRALPGVALLVVAGVAASRVGADGGGLVVYLAGFVVLALRLHAVRARSTRAAVASAVAVAGALALVGIDAATGGSSHVTEAVGSGPGSVAGDLAHRIHLSAASIASTWNAALLFALSTAALCWLALQRPRFAALDALLAAVAVSLVVNDTPVDVAGWGCLSALVVWAWARTGERLSPLE
jgi:hypothetical protein